ncbi:MAG: alkyl hydroperoxide reductase [Lutibacter sp.]|nr:MAG: alkyl hydroperoxide reductase [Lutibacter sp.]
MLKIYTLILFLISVACTTEVKKTTLNAGMWRGEIAMQHKTLPFNFEVIKNYENYQITLINGNEKLILDNVKVTKDSVFFTMHIFDIDIKAKINGNILEGIYVKNYVDDYTLPFKAAFEKNNRVDKAQSNSKFDGKWDMTFTNKNGETSKGIGIFKKENNNLVGTILTPTGDYRYLEGFSTGPDFTLYSFDGNHAFIFEASLENETTLQGDFWSGKSFHESFTAVKNEYIELPNANELTYLKEGYNKIEFSFPDLNGNLVSLSDKKYNNKVIILQIFGTWCPNCMDETKFFSKWYSENKQRGVEIIGLAFEAKNDFNYAKKRVQKMKDRLNIEYDFLIAGTSNKNEASKKLPMLNKIMSFPTSIFIDKKGNVRNIHTGFSGPATGDYYLKFIDEFNFLMDELLKEEF